MASILPSCQLLLNLGSQDRARGTVATPKEVIPGNNGYVFSVGQMASLALAAHDRTLRLLAPGATAQQMGQGATHKVNETKWNWAGGVAPAAWLPCDFP